MSPVETPTEYRHRRMRKGLIHKPDRTDPHHEKEWRKNRDHIREIFMETYLRSGLIPHYMVTRNYYYEVHGRNKVIRNNKRVGNVLEDLFNPRNKKSYAVGIDHFIERHKDTFIQDENEEWVIKKGSYHVHTLVSDIDPRVITRPNKKLRKLIRRVYGERGIQNSLLNERHGMNTTIKCLIDYALRDRCSFIGHSDNSLDIINADEYEGYDGYKGWKGLVSYVTKDMYSIDNIDDIFDYNNNKTLRGIKSKNEKNNTTKSKVYTTESSIKKADNQMLICV